MSFAPLYKGCKCGTTWKVITHSDFDLERDKEYVRKVCTECGQEVTDEVRDEKGNLMVHVLNDAELLVEQQYHNPFGFDTDDDDQEDY